mgnify:FL=1
MSFDNIPGQQKTKRILKDSISKNRISHAYLFTGNNGLGKSEIAGEFAQAIFCENNIADSCGECLSCQKFAHGNHPDFHRITVQEDHKKILIDQIRELQKEISYKPYESNYKVYIIEEAAKMTIQAQNSLLKTLEEPPEYAIIILTNENKNELIPTIISRCQEVKLHNQPLEIVKEYLINTEGFNSEDAQLYATLARGKYKKAVKLASKQDFVENRNKIIEFISNIDSKDNYEIFNITEQLIKLSDTEFPLFELILSYFRDLLVMKRNGNNDIINFDFTDLIKQSSENFTSESLFELTELVNTYRDYYYRNIKKELLFPSLLLKIRNKKEL